MTDQTFWKRLTLFLLGIAVLAVAFWPDLAKSPRPLFAQGNSGNTETLTPSITPTTMTPTPSLTPTPTATGPTPTPTATSTFFFTPTPTFTVMPGSTPTKVKRVVNEIRQPQPGDVIARQAQIIGTPLLPLFNRFDIHISPAGLENWRWLVTKYEVIHDDVLHVLDTTALADGLYDIRVRAIDDTGNYTEAIVRGVAINNKNPPTPTLAPGATAAAFSPLPTPTFTPDPRRVPGGGPGFYAPDAGSVVRGQVPIVATAYGPRENPFQRYELAISPAGMENWTLLHGAERQAWQEPIYYWETTEYADGLYDLRLRIVHRDSNYAEYFLRNLSVANQSAPILAFEPPVGISAPRSGSEISGVVEFQGTVPAEELLRWELAWSPGGREEWQFLVSSEAAVNDGVLARLDLRQLPEGVYDFRLRIVKEDTNYTESVIRGLRLVQP